MISRIPLSPLSLWPPDRLIWHYTRFGVFTVRSAYHLAMSIKTRNSDRASDSSSSEIKNFFIRLWSLMIPNKVKLFAWMFEHFTSKGN